MRQEIMHSIVTNLKEVQELTEILDDGSQNASFFLRNIVDKIHEVAQWSQSLVLHRQKKEE